MLRKPMVILVFEGEKTELTSINAEYAVSVLHRHLSVQQNEIN